MVSKSSQEKFSRAEYQLGTLFEHGKGVKQDYKKAADFYAKAAAQGNAEAKAAAEALAPKIAEQEAAKKTTTSKKK
ncbi:MAG: SEL1-like repeat protein [Cellvibrionales bacterium]|nr:SEL1-like repeat protein [Cellvibrionales bacterium]